MQPTDIAAQAVAILGSVAAGSISVAQGVATKVIGDLISERLHRDGHADAWTEFLKDPQNDSLVRHLIREAIQEDRAFQEKLETALRTAVDEAQGVAAQRAVNITKSGDVQFGDRGDSITGGRVATHSGTYNEIKGGRVATGGGTYNEHNIRKTIKSPTGAAIIASIVLVLLVFGGWGVGDLLTSPKDGGLTANSTCRQFLNADQESQRKALADIGISEGLPGYSGPFSYLEVDSQCGPMPNMKIGTLMKQVGNP